MSSASTTLFKKKKKKKTKSTARNRGTKRKAEDLLTPVANAGEGEAKPSAPESGDEEDLAVDVISLQRSRSRRRGNGINTSALLKPRKDAWAEADATAAAEAKKQQQEEQFNAPKVGLQTNDAFNARGGMVTSSADNAEASAEEAKLKSLMDAFVNREVQKVKSSVNGSPNQGDAEGTIADGSKSTQIAGKSGGATGPAHTDNGAKGSGKKVSTEDDDTSGGPLAWNTGLAEVALPAADKWRNIERTAQMTERTIDRNGFRKSMNTEKTKSRISDDPMAAAHQEIEKQLAFMQRRDRRDGKGAAGAVGNFNSNFNTNWSVRKAEQGLRNMPNGIHGRRGNGSGARQNRGDSRNNESTDFQIARNFRQKNQGRR